MRTDLYGRYAIALKVGLDDLHVGYEMFVMIARVLFTSDASLVRYRNAPVKLPILFCSSKPGFINVLRKSMMIPISLLQDTHMLHDVE